MFKPFDIFHGRLSSSSTDPLQGREERSTFQLLNDAIDTGLEESIPEPTPLDKPRIRIVGEIKLGSVWNFNDDSSAEDLRQLFTRSNEADQLYGSVDFDRSIVNSITGSPFFLYDSTGGNRQENVAGAATNGGTSKGEGPYRYKPEMWNERFQELLAYREKFKNVLVPHNWSDNKALAQWVKRQRYQYKLRCQGKHSTLTSERLTSLNEIGFVWSSHNAAWEEKFLDLIEFTESHGHCNVPFNYKVSTLAVWVRCQRKQYKSLVCRTKRSTMTEERFLKLKSIGFEFSPRGPF